jgi:CRISPR-associated protein Cas5t
MSYLLVELACQTATFRNPEFQNFHKTYNLPVPTTQKGIAGAALGLSPKASAAFFRTGFEFGVYGNSLGKSNDLWKYRKLKQKTFISDILTREILFENNFILVYGNESKKIINDLQSAFENPVYALTLGNSDSLVKVVNTSIKPVSENCEKLENCMVEGNLMNEILDQPQNYEFSLKDGINPISFEIPFDFEYESDNGMRKVSKRREMTFLSNGAFVRGLIKKGVHYRKNDTVIQIPVFKLDA